MHHVSLCCLPSCHRYSTHVFTDEIMRLIEQYEDGQPPLFLCMAVCQLSLMSHCR